MFVLSRHRDEDILIGHDVVIKVIEIRGDKVRLGFEAPDTVPIHRREVYEEIRKRASLEGLPMEEMKGFLPTTRRSS